MSIKFLRKSMTKSIKYVVAALTLATVGTSAWAYVTSLTNIYLDPISGADSNPGSITKPVKTLSQAEYLRAGTWKKTVHINIAGGNSALPASTNVGASLSGSLATPEIWIGTPVDQMTALATDTRKVPTLTSSMAAADTSAVVDSTAGLPSSGNVLIGFETIPYTSTDSTHFLGLTRPSNATTHATGAPCLVANPRTSTTGTSSTNAIDSTLATFRSGSAASVTAISGTSTNRVMTVTGMSGLTSNDCAPPGAGCTGTYNKEFFFNAASNISTANTGTTSVSSVVATSPNIWTISGMTGGAFSPGSQGRYLKLSGMAKFGNNGVFSIRTFVSATSVQVFNPNGAAEGPTASVVWVEQTLPSNRTGNNGFFFMTSFLSSSSGVFYNPQALVENTSAIYWQDSYRGATVRYTTGSATTNGGKIVTGHGVEAAGTVTCVPVANLVDTDKITITDNDGTFSSLGTNAREFDFETTSAFAGTGIPVNLRGGQLTGTLTMTNGSTAVTGSGTSFTTQVNVGNFIKLDADSGAAWAQVSLVNSDTSITLLANYTGTGGVGATGNVSLNISAAATANALALAINQNLPNAGATPLRIRATTNNTNLATSTQTALVKLRNMLPGSHGNVAITKSVANATFAVTGMTGGIGSPTTTFTTSLAFNPAPAVGNKFVIELPSTTFTFGSSAIISGNGPFGMQAIRFEASSTGSSQLTEMNLWSMADRVVYDFSGCAPTGTGQLYMVGVTIPSFGSVAGQGFNAYVNDSASPFASAAASTIAFNAGIANFNYYSQEQSSLVMTHGELILNTVASVSSGNLDVFRTLTAVSGTLGNAVFNSNSSWLAADQAPLIIQGRGSWIPNGTQTINYGFLAGVLLVDQSVGLAAANVGGDGNGLAGIIVDEGSRINIPAGNTITGNFGDMVLGHQTIPNFVSYATARTADGNGVKGVSDTYGNRIDAQ